MAESKKKKKERTHAIVELLRELYPGEPQVLCELNFHSPFELLVMTILAAQSTDVQVNIVAPKLFAHYPDAEALAGADILHVEELVHATGFFRNKARNLVAMSQALLAHYGREVPTEMEDLVSLPGVGRKTANVIRSAAFGLPGFAVDTHVTRLTQLLGLTAEKDPVKIEAEVCPLLPEEQWGELSLRLVLHGRRICVARRPKCGECLLAPLCPSAFAFANQNPKKH